MAPRPGGLGVVLLMLALAVPAAPAGAEERTVRAEGISSLGSDGRVGVARQRAVRQGLSNAVQLVVGEELPALDAESARTVAARLIGDGARDYVTRFQVVADLGTRAKAVPRAGASHEYAVVVEATVDARLVRERLIQAGLLASGEGAVQQVELTLEELPSYAAYAVVREALVDQLRAESAVPVEFTAGRAVLAVRTRQDGRRLLEGLSAARLEGVQLEPRDADERHARAAVRAVAAPSN